MSFQRTRRVYHTSSPENAAAILREGFAPGWGDAGFGVYFYTNLDDAVEYGLRGGWDGDLIAFAVVEADSTDFPVESVEVNPEWPNPEAYETVVYLPVEPFNDPRDEKVRLRLPARAVVATGKRAKS